MNSRAKKKIAFLGIKGLPSKGGAERVVEEIVDNLKGKYDIYIYCSDSYSKDYQSRYFNLIKIKNLRGKHLGSFSLFLFSAIHALLFKKYDLIHVHNTDAGFIIPLLKIKYRILVTSHGFPYKREKWGKAAKYILKFSEKVFFQFSDLITCVSKSIANELRNKYKKNVYFIPNGIAQPNYIECNSFLKKFELKEKEYICFAAGRIDPTKGCHILLRAFNYVNKNIDLAIIGDFWQKRDYSKILFEMSSERVKFIPFIGEKELLFGIIKNAKLFVFSSTVEAMSIMLLEVAALGVPIICSDIQENVCVMEDNTDYFKSGDEKDLAKKIEYSLEHSEEVSRRAEKTKEWILKKYNWQSISIQYEHHYNHLLSLH